MVYTAERKERKIIGKGIHKRTKREENDLEMHLQRKEMTGKRSICLLTKDRKSSSLDIFPPPYQNVTHCRSVISDRRFVTTYRSPVQSPSFTLDVETDRLSRNVDKYPSTLPKFPTERQFVWTHKGRHYRYTVFRVRHRCYVQ